MIKTKTHWDEETGYALVILYDTKKDKTFMGVAQCHENDMDMKSSFTGLSIAQYRAEIEMYKYYKELLTTELNTLLDFEKSAKCCKHYNEDFQIENLLLFFLTKNPQDETLRILFFIPSYYKNTYENKKTAENLYNLCKYVYTFKNTELIINYYPVLI